MLERDFQKDLIKKLKDRYPGCMVLKNDPNYKSGIPDLTILYKDYWAVLEVKKSEKEALKKQTGTRANQPRYVKRLNEMSFAAYIFPENEEVILHELDKHFARAVPA